MEPEGSKGGNFVNRDRPPNRIQSLFDKGGQGGFLGGGPESLPEDLIACPDCDLLQRTPPLRPGGRARCPRCGKVVAAKKPGSLDRTLPLAIAAAIALIVANATPLMGLSAVGRTASTTIIQGIEGMWVQGERIAAVLVGFCVVVAPAVQIGGTLAVLVAARRFPAPSWAGMLLHLIEFHQPWAMVEVMMLGLLVALVKIADLASVIPGIGMFAVGALVFLLSAMTVSFDPGEVWERVWWANGESPRASRFWGGAGGAGK
jgi:paraquat-inducible protein A